MVSILRRIARRMGFVHRDELAGGKRSFAAGNISRLTSDWIFYPTSADSDVRAGMQVIRSRARELTQNDPYAKAYLRACRKNIVGSDGFRASGEGEGFLRSPRRPDRYQAGQVCQRPDRAEVLPTGAAKVSARSRGGFPSARSNRCV